MKIMVVDDERSERDFIAEVLRAESYEVITASNAEQAVSHFLEGGVDMMTMDEQMPGIRGSELHKILSQEFGAGSRAEGSAVKGLPPILFITAYPQDKDVIRSISGESVVGMLAKPFSPKQLVEAVGRALGQGDAADA